MKIRNGYVSNSSSSNFIIPIGSTFGNNGKFLTVRDIAEYMIKKQMDENIRENHGIDHYETTLSRLFKLEDPNTPISFYSCNYDTFIRKIGNCFLISTCNNVDWKLDRFSRFNNAATTTIKDDLKKYVDSLKKNKKDGRVKNRILSVVEFLDEGGDFYLKSMFNDFYNLNNEIVGVELYHHLNSCPKFPEDYSHKVWDTVKYGMICLKCSKHIFERKDKLEKINKISK